MSSEHFERRLMAILMADVAGYSRLIAADDEGTFAQLNAHHSELIEGSTSAISSRPPASMAMG